MRRFSLSAQQRTKVAARSLRNGEKLGSLAMIELEHAAKALAAHDLTTRLANVIGGIDQLVIEPLVVSLGVVMLDVRINGFAQHLLAEEDHPV